MNAVLYGFTCILLFISFIKDKKKTKMALKKAWKSFENILPEFLVVIGFVGISLAIINPDWISKVLGERSGALGIFLASIIGSVTLIPGFVAFPTAALLLKGGAGVSQIAAFVSSLMMVGVVTLPVEVKYFGKKLALWRNALAYVFSIVVAILLGMGGRAL